MTLPAIVPEVFSRILAVGQEIASEIGTKLDELFPAREPHDHSEWNWASEVGHPCARHLTYARLNWAEATPIDLDGLYRVEEGNRAEWLMKKDLGDIGYELQQSQRTFTIPDLKIKGKVDGLLRLGKRLSDMESELAGWDLREAPADVKTVNPLYWDSTRTLEDIKTHRAHWIRGYPSQLNCYMVGGTHPLGFLILKTFGKRPRIIPMVADLELAEADFSKVKKVNAHVASKTYPEPIPYDRQVCGMCSWGHICPQLHVTSMTAIPPGDLPTLHDYLDLREWHERYMAAREALIGNAEKPGRYYGVNAIEGDVEIRTTTQRRTFTEGVPPEVKSEVKKLTSPYEVKREITITSIERVTD